MSPTKKHTVLAAAVAIGCALAGAPAAAQATASPTPARLRIPRVERPPSVEEFLEGGRPGPSARITGFRQQEPGDGVPASQETEAFLSHDSRNLYIVFVCRDTQPARILAQLGRHDASVLEEDHVGVILDTFGDHQRAYVLAANVLGVQLDGIHTEGKETDYTFDTVWRSEGRRTEFGYIVSIAIPFRGLRFPHADTQRWGVALFRGVPRNNETSFWPYITQRVEGLTNQLGILEGLDGISPGRNAQIVPYGASSAARVLAEDGGTYGRTAEGRSGVDGKIVLKDALTLDLTANPDFAQVESDEPQVTVNQRFEVFFPEKRPFFTENAAYFQTSDYTQSAETLFFSRRVADPLAGARVTGKVGRWAIGGLAIDDRAPGRGRDAEDPLRGHRARIGVARAQREIGAQSKIGVLVTDREFGPGFNRVGALDARIKLSPTWVFTAQAATSATRATDGTAVAGPAYVADLARSGRRFTYDLLYTDRAPGFRTQVGFVPRTDVRRVQQFATYRWRPTSGPVTAFGPNAFVLVGWDHAGRLQDWIVRTPFAVAMKRGTTLFGRWVSSYERFEGLEFREHSVLLQGATTAWNWLSAFAQVERGTRPNYYPAAGLLPSSGRFLDVDVELTLRPTARWRTDVVYIFSGLRTAAPPVSPSAAVFDTHLVRLKTNYQFTRAWSLRAIVDYRGVLPNEHLVALTRDKRLAGDVLLTWQLNPWTAVYAGYTDQYANVRPDPLERGALVATRDPTHSVGRQVFVKTSYLVRF